MEVGKKVKGRSCGHIYLPENMLEDSLTVVFS